MYKKNDGADSGSDEQEESFEPAVDDNLEASLFERRIVLLMGDINEQKAAETQGSLTALSSSSPEKEIFLYFNSKGGDVQSGLALYDFITLFLKAPVIGIVGANCLSMALIVLQACTKRVAAPNSVFCIHAVFAKVQILYNSTFHTRMSELKNDLNEDFQKGNKILAEHSKISLSDVKKLSLSKNGIGATFYADKALKIGLIDEIAKGDKYKIF